MKEEQRKYPRVKKRVKFKFKIADDLISAETIDLSANGVLCITNTHIPPMTRLDILFALSIDDKTEYFTCNGVVVRAEKKKFANPEISEAFQIAIFFEEIEKDGTDKILRAREIVDMPVFGGSIFDSIR